MNYFFITPFATSGDKAAIPVPTQLSGALSFAQGFGPKYEIDPTDPDALRIPRDQTNQFYYLVSTALRELQTQGVPDFITTSDNGGTPFPYDINAICRYADAVYISLVDTNIALPSDATKWTPLDLTGAAYLRKANNLSDLTSPPTARTKLGLGSAAVQSAAYFLQAAAAEITGDGLGLVGSMRCNVVAVAAVNLDVSAAEFFTKSISANTAFTVSGATASKGMGGVLKLTISGGAVATFPANFEWDGGAEPILGNGVHVVGFLTFDGGTTWNAKIVMENQS